MVSFGKIPIKERQSFWVFESVKTANREKDDFAKTPESALAASEVKMTGSKAKEV